MLQQLSVIKSSVHNSQYPTTNPWQYSCYNNSSKYTEIHNPEWLGPL